MALKIARILLLLAFAIYGTAFAVGYFDVSYHELATLMAFGATAIMFLAAVASVVIQFVIPRLKGRADRQS